MARNHIVAAIGIGASILFAACHPASAQIKIGAVLSVTGPASFLGDPEKKTLEMYVDAINAKGGVNGQKLQLVIYDDGGDANNARTFATRLVEEDKIVAMVGGTTTGTTLAMMPVFEEAQNSLHFARRRRADRRAGAEVGVQDAAHRQDGLRKDLCRPQASQVDDDRNYLGHRRLRQVDERTNATMSPASTASQIIHDETYGPRDSDMTPQLTNIKNTAGVQAVVNTGFGQGPAIVTRNYRQLGITLPFYQSHGVASKQFIDLAGAAAEGVRLPAAAILVAEKLPNSDPQKPVVVNYSREYQQKTGQAGVDLRRPCL